MNKLTQIKAYNFNIVKNLYIDLFNFWFLALSLSIFSEMFLYEGLFASLMLTFFRIFCKFGVEGFGLSENLLPKNYFLA